VNMPGARGLPASLRLTAVAAAVILAAGLGISAGLGIPPTTGGKETHSARARWLAGIEVAYPLVVAGMLSAIVTGLIVLAAVRGKSRRVLARFLFAGTMALVGVGLTEAVASLVWVWSHRLPRLAMTPRQDPPGARRDELTLLVVGESSAEGVPYRDWVSVGKIVAWQLRRIFPTQTFHVEIQARAGWTLEQMHQKLTEPRRAPDVILLYAGHNEFASRYGWSHAEPHYDDDREPWLVAAAQRFALYSPFCWLIREARDRARVAARPTPQRRPLVDAPSHSRTQFQERCDDFHRRLERILRDCRDLGILVVLVIPPANDAGFEPNRSVLPACTPRAEREAFARSFLEARRREAWDPEGAIAAYRALISWQPGFAESHFRLGRLLANRGAVAEAEREFGLARDLDGHPMRCPSALQASYRLLAQPYGAILVDGQAALRRWSRSGLLDDDLFNDGLHPSFLGQVALAEAILEALKKRGAFGWPSSIPSPRLDPARCAERFDITAAAWKSVCRFAAGFYQTTSMIRHDPTERLAKRAVYEAALERLEAGAPVDELGVSGLGLVGPRDR